MDLSSPESSRGLTGQICLAARLTVYSAPLSWGFRDEWDTAQAWAVTTKGQRRTPPADTTNGKAGSAQHNLKVWWEEEGHQEGEDTGMGGGAGLCE